MKKIVFLALAAFIMSGIAFTSCDSKKIGSAKLKTEVDSISFLLGKVNGSGMKKNMESQLPTKISDEDFLAGLALGWNNPDDSLFLGKNLQEAIDLINSFFQKAQIDENAKFKAEGEKFLAENQKQTGVITTPSGLQYKVITEGAGIKPEDTDSVKVHFTGKLLDGKVFQSSLDRGIPFEIGVSNVIPGWREAVQLMPEGSKYIFWIPSELAYGEQGSQGIKPNSVLEFEIELIEVIKTKK